MQTPNPGTVGFVFPTNKNVVVTPSGIKAVQVSCQEHVKDPFLPALWAVQIPFRGQCYATRGLVFGGRWGFVSRLFCRAWEWESSPFLGARRGGGRIGCAGVLLPLFHLGWRIFPESVLSALVYSTFFKVIFLGRNYKPFVRSRIGSCQVVPPMKAAFRGYGILEMCSLDHEKGAAFHTNLW